MRQHITPELLDEDLGTPEEIRDSLQDLWRVNRYLGGLRCLRRSLELVMERKRPRTMTILDVGAGSGDVGAWMHAWFGARGVAARVWVLDRQRSHLTCADAPGNGESAPVTPIVADALALPLADNSIDLVTCNLFLHHFHGEDAVTLLQSLYRVARTAIVISDLERSLWPWLAISMTPRPIVSRLSRYDGPASVRQSYRLDELRQLLLQAQMPGPLIWRMWPYRLGAVVWKEGRRG